MHGCTDEDLNQNQMNAKIYLDSRHTLKNGCHVLTVSITHRGQSARIPIGMELEPSRWDARSMSVVKGADRNFINMELHRKLAEVTDTAQKVLVILEREGVEVSATELKNRVKRLLGTRLMMSADAVDDIGTDSGESLVGYYEKIMNQYHGSTRDKYAACLRYIKMYERNWEFLTFASINGRWLNGLNECMRRNGCKSADTRSMYMRPFKHVCECAYDEELVSRNPFKKYHFTIEQEPIEHKVMSTDALRQLLTMDMEEWRKKYRDFFWLSFLCRGANPIDMLTWQKSMIRDGYLYYTRTKTNKEVVAIKIEPEIQELFDKYRGKTNVLCFCDGMKLTGNYAHDEEVKKRCKPFRDRANKYLQELDGYGYLTMYWARHTWSTIGYYVNDDFKAVEIGLSHSKVVTDRYVKAYQEKVDKANRAIIDYVIDKNK